MKKLKFIAEVCHISPKKLNTSDSHLMKSRSLQDTADKSQSNIGT